MLKTPLANDDLYGKVCNDPDIDALADSVKRRGILQPLIVNRQGLVMCGNRRMVAACRAGLDEVPCFVRDIAEDDPEFARLLVECNEQRDKGFDVKMRESGVKSIQTAPQRWLSRQRLDAELRQFSGSIIDPFSADAGRKRKGITRARQFADAVIEICCDCRMRGIRPTVRQVHYLLLNNPPVKDTQTGARYANDEASYNALTNIAARLRVCGELPFDAFADATRRLRNWETFRDAAGYVGEAMGRFGSDFRRNMMQSQDAFFVAAVEKETQAAIFEEHIFRHYPGMPLMVCRGFASLSLAFDVYSAFRESGKRRMVLVVLSDCDPCGEGIVRDIVENLREIGIDANDMSIVRAGLTHDQARRLNARPQPIKRNGKAGETVAARFEARHGTSDVYELEAVPPDALLDIFDDAVQSRLDIGAYNAEVEAEAHDAECILAAHAKITAALGMR